MDTNEKYNGMTLNLLIKGGRNVYLAVVDEGTGDNLLDEDIDDGYIDYLNWTLYALTTDCEPNFVEWDGGMVLSKRYVVEMTVKEVIEAVCEQIGCRVEDASIVESMPL